MTPQQIFDLLDNEVEAIIKKMVAGTKDTFDRYKAEIVFCRHLKTKIKNDLEKEAKRHGMAERKT